MAENTAIEAYGTGVEHGVATQSGYIVTKTVTGKRNVAMRDVNDENGALATRIIKQRHDIVTLDMVAKTGTVPTTDFPEGDLTTALAAYNNWFVNSLSMTRDEDETKVTVELENIGIT
jgi:hypothetical protein